MSDVVLINTPTDFPRMAKGITMPLGLAYIGSYLIKNGYKVKILDLEVEDRSRKNIENIIKKETPKLIGLTCNTHTRFKAFEISNYLKESFPNIHLSIGGPHAAFTYDNILRKTKIDSVIRHEGEETTLELINAVEKGTSFKKILGLSYKNKNRMIHNNPRPFIQNLDSLPFPARHLFNLSNYKLIFPGKEKVKKSIQIITSRGCPFGCKFCSATVFGGRIIRWRSYKNVVDELEYLVEDLGYDGIFIYDDNFVLNTNRLFNICDEVKRRRLEFKFFCYSRVDGVTYKKFKKIAEIGCKVVSFGIESGSQRILDFLNKNITTDEIINAIKTCKKVGIETKGTFIIGSPTESIDDFKKTCELINKIYSIDKDFLRNMGRGMLIYPGTKIFELAMMNGILPKDFDWTKKDYVPNELHVPLYLTPKTKTLLKNAKKIYYTQRFKYLLKHPNELHPKKNLIMFKNLIGKI